MKHKIGILGAGTWGMALARMLTVSGNDVTVWSALEQEIDNLSTTRVHPNLPGMTIPAEMKFTKSVEEVHGQGDPAVRGAVGVRALHRRQGPALCAGRSDHCGRCQGH